MSTERSWEQATAEQNRVCALTRPTIERWRQMPNRDAYVEQMMVTAAAVAYRAGQEVRARDVRNALALSVRLAAGALADGMAATGWVPSADEVVGMLREIADQIQAEG